MAKAGVGAEIVFLLLLQKQVIFGGVLILQLDATSL